MPKQSYLAELGKLLTYMTPWDRERTLEYIGKRFDEAEDEAALLAELGTPVRLAVLYNRGYNPSPDPAAAAAEESEAVQEESSAPPEWEKDEEASGEEAAPAEAPEAAEGEQTTPEEAAPEAAEEAPAPDLPEEAAEEAAPEDTPAEEEEAPAAEETPAQEELPAEAASAEDEPAEPEMPESAPEGKKPGFGRTFAVTVLSIFPGVPLFLLLVLIDVLLLVPGFAGIGGALILAEAGTFSLTHMADALLVFGAALIVFALALLLFFGGLWCAVKLTKVYFKGICALMRAILGKGGRSK